MMKYCIVIIVILLAQATFAQAPRIDSMQIDESKGLLSVYGDFGLAQGNVWCDSVELPVVTWSDTLIISAIPDTGKGSAGPVIVESSVNVFSSTKNITEWKAKCYENMRWEGQYGADREILFYKDDTLFFRIRAALSDSLGQNWDSLRTQLAFPGAYYYFQDCPIIKTTPGPIGEDWVVQRTALSLRKSDSTYASGYLGQSSISQKNKQIRISLSGIKGLSTKYSQVQGSILFNEKYYPFTHNDTSFALALNPDFSIKTIVNNQYNSSSVVAFDYQFPPSIILKSLTTSAILRLPKNYERDLGTEQVTLTWDTLSFMNTYRVQVASDSLLTAIVFDSTWLKPNISLLPLEKSTSYFWRVAGINSEGQSRWSETWKFTTGDKAAVQNNNTSAITLSAYPNPAKDIVHINYSGDKPNTILTVYDITGNIVKRFAKEQLLNSTSIEWDASTIAAGTYIIGLTTGSESRSVIVSIVR